MTIGQACKKAFASENWQYEMIDSPTHRQMMKKWEMTSRYVALVNGGDLDLEHDFDRTVARLMESEDE